MTTHLARLSDRELVASVHAAAHNQRAATGRLIALLAELDARRLYLAEGCSSLFTYCTQVLHFSEHAAYNRIEAARAAHRFPIILEMMEAGAITLTAVRLLAPHLTDDNHRDLLVRARHKMTRDVELLVATIRPCADAPSFVRKLPAPRAKPDAPARPEQPPQHDASVSSQDAAPVHDVGVSSQDMAPLVPASSPMPSQAAASIKPLAPERYKIQVTVSGKTYGVLRRAQDLLRHSIPNGDPAQIISRALELLVKELERKKVAATDRPRHARAVGSSRTRHIPAQVRRTVWQRDEGRCQYVGAQGRCAETGFLEFHHIVPFADGGEPTARNLELRCRAHNGYEYDLWSGERPTPNMREERLLW